MPWNSRRKKIDSYAHPNPRSIIYQWLPQRPGNPQRGSDDVIKAILPIPSQGVDGGKEGLEK